MEALIKGAVCAEFGTYEDDCNAAVDSYLPEIMTLFSESVVCTGVDEAVSLSSSVCRFEWNITSPLQLYLSFVNNIFISFVDLDICTHQ